MSRRPSSYHASEFRSTLKDIRGYRGTCPCHGFEFNCRAGAFGCHAGNHTAALQSLLFPPPQAWRYSSHQLSALSSPSNSMDTVWEAYLNFGRGLALRLQDAAMYEPAAAKPNMASPMPAAAEFHSLASVQHITQPRLA